ncbi:MAG: SAM-dependent methyltransferase [Candidatus Bathyarchaeia archaeon]|jgi:hypothetical protein
MNSVDLTFKHNINKGRHGWIRLTPAYSIILVKNILDDLSDGEKEYVLDPFSGTGTTGLVSAESGIPCDLYETNPFLEWIARAKTRRYSSDQIENARKAALLIIKDANDYPSNKLWAPAIFRIERWWNPTVLDVLKRVCFGISLNTEKDDGYIADLLRVAFCKLLIKWSNAAFNHQSMSFKQEAQNDSLKDNLLKEMLDFFELELNQILEAASQNPNAQVNVYLHNSKKMPSDIKSRYTCVITSPPYANRMSYVREVRPYMYWLNLIKESKEAADIEWDATGGTWGTATSRLNGWKPRGFFKNDREFLEMITKINAESQLLANYVHRYFEDMYSHFSSLSSVLKQSAQLHYIIGNSKFYDIIVPTEEIYAKIMKNNGFENVKTNLLRKRSSKKELYEFHISANYEKSSLMC